MEKKKCRSCNKTKPGSDFYASATTKDELQSYCKKCSNMKAKKHRDDNIEKYRENEKQYRAIHRNKIYEYHKEYYQKKEVKAKTAIYQKSYKQINKKKLNSYHKEWSQKNAEICRKNALEYYHKNKQRILAQRKLDYVNKKK